MGDFSIDFFELPLSRYLVRWATTWDTVPNSLLIHSGIDRVDLSYQLMIECY
jgi:hypothetical protein